MKMLSRHYTELKRRIKENGYDIGAGVVSEWHRWDLFHHVLGAQRSCGFDLYSYLNDDNIDTALRRICKELSE